MRISEFFVCFNKYIAKIRHIAYLFFILLSFVVDTKAVFSYWNHILHPSIKGPAGFRTFFPLVWHYYTTLTDLLSFSGGIFK